MEQKFIAALKEMREEALKLGARIRPVEEDKALQMAHRTLSGHRESEGFGVLAEKGRLDLSLEALAIDKRFTALFSDEEANEALNRLLDAGYHF